MAFGFTDEQQSVIDARSCNLLVSAAAGSGKTAVLSERIIGLITQGDNPLDIDRILVLTFTKAAASEMRGRITEAIQKRLEEEPKNEHLQKQTTLIHNAQITTIDSFCLFVIRNNFHAINLEPDFRIAESAETKLLFEDTMSEVIEDFYEEGREDFLYCTEFFSAGKKDDKIETILEKLHNLANGFPFPEKWLNDRKKDYVIDGFVDDEPWMKEYLKSVMESVEGHIASLRYALTLCTPENGLEPYHKAIESDISELEGLLNCDSYSSLQKGIASLEFITLSSVKKDTYDEKCKNTVTEIRKKAKTIRDLGKTAFALSEEEIKEQMACCVKAECALVDAALEIEKRFLAKKRELKIVDFSDMEHLALNILVKTNESGDVVPSDVAEEYRNHFAEILLDEYQDSNLIQEYIMWALSGESTGHYNRFMVGDMKQCIYKFRQSDPTIFLEKYNTYDKAEDAKTRRIDLHSNFRSRDEVIDTVNGIFCQLMQKGVGGIDYDEDAALHRGAVYEPSPNKKTELLIIKESEDKKKLPNAELEARVIAGRIKELMQSQTVFDKKEKKTRPVKYSDIVILLRAAKGYAEEFSNILLELDIPAYVTSTDGYFNAIEIQDILNFLRIIDNPLQDIPLFGTLRSIFGGFSDEEIATIKVGSPESIYFYDSLTDCDVESTLRKRIDEFINKLSEYRKLSSYLSIHELLRKIIGDYNYMAYVSSRPGGDSKAANVEMLMTKASDYEKTSYYGLYHFLRYIDKAEKFEIDFGQASILDENADVVRIMTDHKSKGLEFPICIVAGLGKPFRIDTDGLIADSKFGLGFAYIDSVRRIKCKNIRREAVSRVIRKDQIAEEIRVLYVALTRAREKLILTGVTGDFEKTFSSLVCETSGEVALPISTVLGCKSFMDMVLHTIYRNKDFDEIRRAYGFEIDSLSPVYSVDMGVDVALVSSDSINTDELTESVRNQARIDEIAKISAGSASVTCKEEIKKIGEIFDRVYPYDNLRNLFTKTTVSELKMAQIRKMSKLYDENQEDNTIPELDAIPDFANNEIKPIVPFFACAKEDVTGEKSEDGQMIDASEGSQGSAASSADGATRGTAYHRVMELFDFACLCEASNVSDVSDENNPSNSGREKEYVGKLYKDFLARMISEGKISKEAASLVNEKKIINFLSGNLAKRMGIAAKNNLLKKEQPFVLGIPASELLSELPETETVLIQGIIDAFFIEDGEYVLVDYKTDAVSSGEELAKRYKTQIDYYERALNQLSGGTVKVKESVLYSFSLQEVVPV